MDTEDVRIDAIPTAVKVDINNVRGILRDDLPIEHLHMEMEDGEILTLREEGDQVDLVMEWNDFEKKNFEYSGLHFSWRKDRVAWLIAKPRSEILLSETFVTVKARMAPAWFASCCR